MISLTQRLVFGFSCSALLLSAADPSLKEIVTQAAKHYQVRDSVASDFTYTESFHNVNFNPKGKKTLDVSDTFDVTLLEGVPYYRHTSHDGKPLSHAEEEREQKKMSDIAAARRAGNRQAGIYPHGMTLKLPFTGLAEDFTLTSQGTAEVDGRSAYVIEAAPTVAFSANPRTDAFAKAVRLKLFIDTQDFEIARATAEVVSDGTQYRRGSLIELECRKIRGEVWLRTYFHFKGDVTDGSRIVTAEAEQKRYQFLKFSTEAQMTPQEMK